MKKQDALDKAKADKNAISASGPASSGSDNNDPEGWSVATKSMSGKNDLDSSSFSGAIEKVLSESSKKVTITITIE